jgi:hypothetical protein
LEKLLGVCKRVARKHALADLFFGDEPATEKRGEARDLGVPRPIEIPLKNVARDARKEGLKSLKRCGSRWWRPELG